MSKSALKILPALMVAVSALVAQPVFGVGVANTLLVFTEESSTVLTATVGGNPFGTVSLTSPDRWDWTLPADRPFITHVGNLEPLTYWLEPGSTALGNLVQADFFGTPEGLVGGAHIASDFDFTPLGTVPDSTIQQNFLTFEYPGGSVETFDVQFIDKGDVATAPDTGTACSLFGLSLAGLAFLRRKLC